MALREGLFRYLTPPTSDRNTFVPRYPDVMAKRGQSGQNKHGNRYLAVEKAVYGRVRRRRDRCIVHPATESVVIIAFDLRTGNPLEGPQQYGLCRPDWKAVAES